MTLLASEKIPLHFMIYYFTYGFKFNEDCFELNPNLEHLRLLLDFFVDHSVLNFLFNDFKEVVQILKLVLQA